MRLSSCFFMLLVAAVAAAASQLYAADSVSIDHVTLIDGTGRPAEQDMCVAVSGDRISSVAHCPSTSGAGGTHIDGRGKFLIPGMMDVHIHLAGGRMFDPSSGQANEKIGILALQGYLYSGVTTVLDVGNCAPYIFKLRDMERSGQIVSTRLLAAGGIVTYPGSHGSGRCSTDIASWPQDAPKLEAALALKPDYIKITYDEHGWGTRPMITLLTTDLIHQIVEYSNDHGVRVTAHTSDEKRSREAIFAGVDTLAHPVIQGPVSDKWVNLMAARKTPFATTLTIGEGYSRLAEHPEYLDQPLYKAILPPEEITRLKTKEHAFQQTNRWAAWMKVMTPVAQENIRKIDEAGGIAAVGTDQTSGAAVHRELELIVAGGVSPLHAIRMATLNGAVFLGKDRDMGSVEEGKIADLVLLDADPLADINNTKKVNTVIKAGQVIDRSKLDLPVNGRWQSDLGAGVSFAIGGEEE
jgi:imidazolonepropionase-like amidohydrolase